ncbi:hypothetical protein PLEOSDRAFT_168600 [Pleurotus ostreatus PC15]|uniref:Uncharacterized protein n=1 Tax=Pleurotus ostreatus (strain PC15) TaxID=1137138 RepID=A0A067NU78_PLEO1|nr:hypothetical protein PLEOSDRAFT_168600 [Pleurotus ostreatus PC15]
MPVERYTTTRDRRHARRFQQHPYLPRPPGAHHRRTGITHGSMQLPTVGLGNVGGYGSTINLHLDQTGQGQGVVLQYLRLFGEAQTAALVAAQIQSPLPSANTLHNIQGFALTHHAAQSGDGRPSSIMMSVEFSILVTEMEMLTAYRSEE